MKTEMNTFTARVACPHCGTASVFKANQLIDTIKDPYAVEKVLDASWFTHTCPACGERQTVLFTCLFHDMQERILYAYADNEEDYEKFRAYLTKDFAEDDPMGEVLKGWVDTCTCRLTDNFASFQEKLLLAYLGIDDRAVEVCKYMTELILLQEGKLTNIENMYFNTDGDRWVFLIDNGEDEFSTTDLPKEMYQDVVETVVPDMESEENRVVYDYDWVRSHFGKFMGA